MNDDLSYVREHVPEYGGYDDEPARHDSEQRVRSMVGSSLAKARLQHEDALDETERQRLDELIFRCGFADQELVKAIEHADLDPGALSVLVGCDRRLVDLAERVEKADARDLVACIDDVDTSLNARRESVVHLVPGEVTSR